MHLISLSGAIAVCALFGSHALGLSLWPGIAIVQRICRCVAPGAIILLHDGDDRDERPDRSAMLEALPELLDAIIAEGYRFVTVSDLIAESSGDSRDPERT